MSREPRTEPIRLQPLVRSRLSGLGAAGEAWAADLPGRLRELEEQWGVRAERRTLPGGSASLVVAASTPDGERRVIKLAAPGADVAQEARVLAAARGRGYARLLGHDPSHQALLLERLGRSADQTPAEPEQTIGLLAATLRLAWTVSERAAARSVAGQTSAGQASLPGPVHDRAGALHRLVVRLAAETDHDASPSVLARALRFAEQRAAALDPARCVVVHGDPHPANLLRVLEPRPGGETGWCFVDPDGFRGDPASDAGAVVRDFSGRLDGPGAVARLEAWCRLAAEATDQHEQEVWEWAFLQRVSTGLYVTSIGARGLGRTFLRSAATLLADGRDPSPAPASLRGPRGGHTPPRAG